LKLAWPCAQRKGIHKVVPRSCESHPS
jgi:hypothetical protein